MSPRAAWRLESLGFAEVYEYKAGNLDWLAARLRTEDTNAEKPRAGAIARKDVPTCHLDERLSEVRDPAHRAGWDAALVVNDERVVFGLLRANELAGDAGQLIPRRCAQGRARSGPTSWPKRWPERWSTTNVRARL